MFGLKIFADTPKDIATKIIEKAASDGLGIEVLLLLHSGIRFRADALEWMTDIEAYHQIKHKTLHTAHVASQGIDIGSKRVMESLLRDIEDARTLGIDQLVLHYHHTLPVDQRDPALAHDNLVKISNLAAQRGVTFFIENTLFAEAPIGEHGADADYYRNLFDFILDNNLTNLGFCFDIGHAKVFSNDNFATWMQLLDNFSEKDIPLHFHLHNNTGNKDDHLSFRIAESKGLNEGDAFTCGINYLDIVSLIKRKYNGMKLLEVHSSEALPQYDWLRTKLA